MFKKYFTLFLSILLVLTMALGLAGCSSTKEKSPTTSSSIGADKTSPAANANKDTGVSSNSLGKSSSTSKTFTLKELCKYDGKNGNPAYAAVDGIVYDVTNDRAWRDGGHQSYRAGTDLTKDMANAPHGRQVLDGLPVVGKLAD